MSFTKLVIVSFLALLPASMVGAQQWAEKMFEVKEHDFGVVARGSKQLFRFEFTNHYEEDVRS